MRRSTDGSGITVSPSRPRPDGDEYVARLKSKVQLQAKELHTLQTQLDEAQEYSFLCETRLRELAPSIELPVSASTSLNHATCRGEPTHVLSTIARCAKTRLEAEARVNKLDSARLALEQKCAFQNNSLRELRSAISTRDRELSTIRRRCSTLESQNEKLRSSSAALSTKVTKLEYSLVSQRASSRPASASRTVVVDTSRDSDMLLHDARDELRSLREQLDVSEKRRIELERRVKRLASMTTTPRASRRRGTTDNDSSMNTVASDAATERDALRAQCRYIIDEADRRVRALEAELASTTTDKEDLISMLVDMRDEKETSASEMEELRRENAALKRAMHRYDGVVSESLEDVYPISSATERNHSHEQTGAGLVTERADERTTSDEKNAFSTTTPSSSMMTDPRIDNFDMDAILEVETQLARFKKLKAEQEAQILRLRLLQDKVVDDSSGGDDKGTEEQNVDGDVGSHQDALKDILMQMQRTPNRT